MNIRQKNITNPKLAVTLTLIVGGLLSATLNPRAHAKEPVFQRVFGPEVQTGPYKHPACLEELANGDLLMVYYGGQGEYANDTAVFASRLKKGESRWTDPVAIARDPLRSLGNGVIWQAPNGWVWMFYVVRFGPTWSDSRIQAKVSQDDGHSWSDPTVVSFERGLMVRNRPIVLANGTYLLPAYEEKGEDKEEVGKESVSSCFSFDPKKPTEGWQRLGSIKSDKGNIQPAIVELEPNHLLAYCRRGGGYGPNSSGFIVSGESLDGGKTWTKGIDTAFPNPNSAVDMIKARNGHLILLYNHSMTSRTPLSVAVSTDNGKSWPIRRDLASDNNTYAYPILFQSRDGNLHAVYTSDARKVIHHLVFDEDWILQANKPQ
jgi:predicted neuraminidase